jgi:hypothetical protein
MLFMKLSRQKVITYIDDFLNGRGGEWDWDDFTSIPLDDQNLESMRKLCVSLPELYPPNKSGQYCNEAGMELLSKIVKDLRLNDR